MARKSPQTTLNSHFAMVEADLQTRLLVTEDALAAVLTTLSELLAHLKGTGAIENDPEFVKTWVSAVTVLESRGLARRPLPGEPPVPGVICPKCDSKLRNVAGDPGDRCDWCGHIFLLVCPACARELENLGGLPGETCLWCQHRF